MSVLGTLLAQTEFTYEPVAAEAVGAFAGVMIFVWIALVLVSIVGLILWIWAIVDAAKREFENPGNKNVWLIVLIVGFVVGLSLIVAIVYLIAGRKGGTIPGSSGPSQPTQSDGGGEGINQ